MDYETLALRREGPVLWCTLNRPEALNTFSAKFVEEYHALLDSLAGDPATRIVVLTAYGSVATAIQALRRGAVHYVTKPADADEILAAFEREFNADGGEDRSAPLRLMSLDRVEWEHINRVLVECGGNVSEAARQLGVHRRTLQRKLWKYPASR